MKYETKFNFMDRVRKIGFFRQPYKVDCSFCGATGKITGKDGSNKICPECLGHKYFTEHKNERWVLGEMLTIGEVRITETAERKDLDSMFTNYGPQEHQYEEVYMCYETGIGSGTIHKAENLFATDEEAQAECDRRNNEGIKP